MDPLGRARGRGRADAIDNQQRPIPPAQILRPLAPAGGGAASAGVPPTGRASHIQLTAEEQRGATLATRGATRGRRTLHDLVVTRPDFVADNKKGSSGRAVSLTANYFRLQTMPSWKIYQYHVDFEPQIDITGARKALFRTHRERFQGFIFDGAILLTSTKLDEDEVVYPTRREDGQEYRIKVRFIKNVSMTDEMSLMVLNNILRRGMEGLRLQIVGRNFFDAAAKIPIPAYKLELWPGYITSIRQHENDVLLCAEISTKVMRNETLHDILQEAIRNTRDYKDHFAKTVIGTTVLTDYSNKTYRVDDVDWESSPQTEFATREGNISYIQYYERRYNIIIRDHKQPLIKTRSTDRKIRSGESAVISLIPELCRSTGLTDDMRANFKLMKAVAEYTRIGPAQRVKRLLDFNTRLQTTPGSMEILREWTMTLDRELISMTGRELEPEKIVFGPREVMGTNEADWTRALRENKFHTAINLSNWCCVAPKRAERETKDFVRILQDAVRNMGMAIDQPKM